jgi:hypothetical protein
MAMYQADITYADSINRVHHHYVNDIVAMGMSGAFEKAMDSYFASNKAYEIKKVVIERQQSVYRGS